MKYTVTTTANKWERTKNDDSSKLRIYNIGEYSVQVSVDNGSYCEPFYRNQYIDVNITATPISIKSIGGTSIVRTYRVYGVNHDECDIEGYFDTTILSEDNVSSLIGQKAVLRTNVVQNISGNLSNSNVPSTQAVQNALNEISATIGTPIKYKGTVQTFDKLPTQNRLIGDMYNVVEPYDDYLGGTNFVWNGEVWDALGGTLEILPSAIKSFNDNYEEKTVTFNNAVRQAEIDLDNLTSDKILSVDEKVNSVSDDIDEYKEFISTEAFKIADTVAQVQATQRAVNDKAEEVTIAAKNIVDDVAEASKLRDELGDISTAVSTVTKAESNVKSLEDSAWLAVSRAEEISDPENRIGNLQQTKSNRGELYLNCGALSTIKKDSLLNPFSYIWTMAMNQEEFIKHKGNSPAFFGNENYFGSPTTYQGWAVCRTSETNVLFGMSGINTSSGYIYTNVNVLPYLDGNSHVWSVVYTGNQLKLIVDGNVLSTISATFNVEQSRIPFQIGQSTLTSTANNGVWGKFSRIKYFNFDITSADAPYTLADYVVGKDESPLLKNNQPVIAYPNTTGLSVGANNRVTLTNTAKIYPRAFQSGTFKNGKTYKIRVQGTITGSNDDAKSLLIYLPTDKFTMYRTDVSTGEVEDVSAKASVAYTIKPDGKEYIVDIEFTATADSNTDNTYVGIDPVDTSVENWFTITAWTDGTLLSLADYTFDGEVLDNSGNGNHATVTGNVKGTNDVAVETLYSKFAARIQSLINK